VGVLALGVLALVAGAGFGTPALAPLGAGLVAAPVLAVIAVEVARRGLSVTREVEPDRLTAGEGALVRAVLRGWPVRAGLVRALERAVDPGVPAGAGPLARAGVHGRRLDRIEVAWALAPARRGEHPLSPVRATLADPFGLVERAATGSGAAALLVAPRTVPVGVDLAVGEEDGVALGGGRRRLSTGLDLDGVRDYLPGDALSRVHWAQSARRGRLQTKDMHAAAGGGRPAIVLLDCRADAGAHPEAFETAVSAAASLARHLLSSGRPVTVVHTGTAPRLAPSARWEEVERALARVARDGTTPVSAAVAGLSTRRPAPAAALVVTADPDAELPRAIRRARGAGVRVACILCGAAAALATDVHAAGARVLAVHGMDALERSLANGGMRARR
jgi:uncharacterized protein (DUF58 family)